MINGVAPHVSFYFSLGTLSVASTALENRKWAVESPGCRGGNPFNQVHSGRQLFQRTFWDNRFFSEWHFQMWHVLIFQLVVINGQYWWRFLRVTIPRTKNRRQNTSCDKKKKRKKPRDSAKLYQKKEWTKDAGISLGKPQNLYDE